MSLQVKKQMSTLFEQQNMMSPQMMDMMKGMDFNQVRDSDALVLCLINSHTKAAPTAS